MKIKVVVNIPNSGNCVGCKYFKEHVKAVSPVDDKITYKCRLFKRKIKNNERCEECKNCEVIDK